MSQDEGMYNDPEEFHPERFVDDAQLDPKKIVLGFGRRYEPGSRS